MRSVWKAPISFIAAASIGLLLAGCGGGGGGGSSATTTTQSVVGHVFNAANGNPLAGATVTIPSLGKSTTTDADGLWRFDDLAATFTGGDVTVTAPGFSDETLTIAKEGVSLESPVVGLTPVGTAVNITPGTGGTVTQAVAAAPGVASVQLDIPAGALNGSTPVAVDITPVINLPEDEEVTTQTVGDVSTHRPEIEIRIRPAGPIGRAATIRIPLPFPMDPGSTVPVILFKDAAWREIATATVDSSGLIAVAQISELGRLGLAAWHAFKCVKSVLPSVNLEEVTSESIQSDMDNLPDRKYVISKVITAGKTALITARFKSTITSVNLPTSPIDEEIISLGNRNVRGLLADSLTRGPWDMAAGAVKFKLFREACTVKRFVAGRSISDAGTFNVDFGVPDWPIPTTHNQGSVQ